MSAALKLPPDPPMHMTVAEFLAWDSGDRSGRLWQLRDGAPESMAPASENHGAIQSEISRLIGNHLAAHRPGCRVVTTPGVVPRVRASDNARIPDLAVTCMPPRGDRLMEAPVLVIEVLSPSNADETWGNVWSYTTMPSVEEILVISSTSATADLLRRGADGARPEAAMRIGGSDMMHLSSIGLELPLQAAYRTTDIT
jgi:Uma2 family endonuclease